MIALTRDERDELSVLVPDGPTCLEELLFAAILLEQSATADSAARANNALMNFAGVGYAFVRGSRTDERLLLRLARARRAASITEVAQW